LFEEVNAYYVLIIIETVFDQLFYSS